MTKDHFYYKVDKKGRKLYLRLDYYNIQKRIAKFSFTLVHTEKTMFDRETSNNMYQWNKKYFQKLGRKLIKWEPFDITNTAYYRNLTLKP